MRSDASNEALNLDFFSLDDFTPDTDFTCEIQATPKAAKRLKRYDELIPATESHLIKPPVTPEIPEYGLCYENAERLALDLKIKKNSRYYAYINGSFHFGDFIEALMVVNNWHTDRMIISTLGMSENNVDSLRNLLQGEFVDTLDLVISDYFFSHERNNLIPYLYQQLDIENRFQLAVAGSHCKLCVFTTDEGLHIGIRGSANLRSSSCIEHITIEENEMINKIDIRIHDRIIDTFKTINKSLRGKTLWHQVHPHQENQVKPEKEKDPQQKRGNPSATKHRFPKA
ncbi:hypothetical protein [Larkinella humicola]|uniref:Uncharacterized protein n=1 Tax=Larkinella humicola TaxID=2607654 RepID=A0A5N1JTU5_9BACT|nr:hypothetical protein [Larkinella humicola]KAA9357223.1 hypothetical protein F0P93_05665 [Larkinella humicola]